MRAVPPSLPDAVQGPTALAVVLRAAAPTGAAALLALAPVGLPPRSGALEAAIIRTQVERAATIPAATDVVTVGDSTGLINIDPGALAAALDGATVEGLNTLGFAGPRGHAVLLDAFQRRGGAPRRVLITLRNLAPPSGPNARLVDRLLRQPVPPAPPTWPLRVRARLAAAVEPVLFLPFPGAWGDYYGGRDRFDAVLRARHGFAHDPVAPKPDSLGALLHPPYAVNDKFRAELPALRAAVAAVGAERVRLVLMPESTFWSPHDVAPARASALALLHAQLGLDPARQLAGLPAQLPADQFASFAHLNARGRAVLTADLAAALRRDRARHPW